MFQKMVKFEKEKLRLVILGGRKGTCALAVQSWVLKNCKWETSGYRVVSFLNGDTLGLVHFAGGLSMDLSLGICKMLLLLPAFRINSVRCEARI